MLAGIQAWKSPPDVRSDGLHFGRYERASQDIRREALTGNRLMRQADTGVMNTGIGSLNRL